MIRRRLKTSAVFVTLSLGLLSTAEAQVAAPVPPPVPRETYDAPGRLVALPDHRRLNLFCMGHGSPTVLLESGFGAGAFAWGRTQPRIAAVTRVCAYDRAGYGFSDAGPLPRDGQAIARDLEHGLASAGIGGPYVLVGHSAGGLYIRLFAARHRREVQGLVFVDSSIPHQLQRIAELSGTAPGTMDGLRRRPARCLEIAEGKGAPALEPEHQACVTQAGPGPKDVATRPDIWRSELSELDTLFDQTSDEVDRTRGLLKDIPAIVLTAWSADGPAAMPADPAAGGWPGLHRQLAAGFRRGQQRLVKSSHLMMNDRPEVVAAAAIELVEQARKAR